MTTYRKMTGNGPIVTGILLSLSLFFGAALFFTPLLKLTQLGDTTLFFLSRLIFWLFLLLIYLYAVKRERQPFLLWTEKRASLVFYIASVLAILMILFIGLGILSYILVHAGLNKESYRMVRMIQMLKHHTALLFFTCITAGFTEELVFRGYLIPRLQLFFKTPFIPIVLSSLLFGLGHLAYGTVAQVVVPTFIGFIFALYYQKYRNITVLIFCHFIWDLLILYIRIQK